jgi:predicted transcriptional regulator of viral defense system
MPGQVYTILHDAAVDQGGYITTRHARDLNVPTVRLEVMRQRGTLERVSRGVYRFRDVPAGPLDQYLAATLWPLEVQGTLSHATALDLHALCDVNPSRIDVTVPAGFRTTRTPPEVMRLHRRDLTDGDVTWFEGIPIVTVYQAILGSIEVGVGWNLIEQALTNARRRGLITRAQAAELRALRGAHRPADAPR